MSKLSQSIKTHFTTVITDQSFCDQLITSVQTFNITALNIPTQLTAIRNICNVTSELPKVQFTSVVLPTKFVPTMQPSSVSSIYKTSSSTSKKNVFATTSILGIFLMVAVALSCIGMVLLLFCCSRKRITKSHQYDILVLLNDNEEIIFENIHHEDIIASRRYEFFFFINLLSIMSFLGTVCI